MTENVNTRDDPREPIRGGATGEWRLLTEPGLMRRWWAEGQVAAIVGHQFTLDVPGYGKQPCKMLEVDPPHRFVYTFTPAWTLTWRLEAEGTGTRVFLEHSGFDLVDERMAEAFDRMGPGGVTSSSPGSQNPRHTLKSCWQLPYKEEHDARSRHHQAW
jgi:Activator of Hsp90 ATPase homolog 1-like protein